MVEHLPNHLRSHRRRLGLSQHEIAFLLDVRHGAKVSRYERFRRCPTLATAFRLAIVFETPVEELFPGMAAHAEFVVIDRARLLERRLQAARGTSADAEKVAALRRLIDPREEVVYEPISLS